MTREISAPTWTLLELTGMGIVPYSTRGAKQSLAPIRQQGANGFRDVNGVWRPIGNANFELYASSITCTDQKPIALDGVWRGKILTVSCIHELSYKTAGGSPSRPVVSGSSYEVGDYTIYCPQLTMVVMDFSSDSDEFESEYSWSMQLEEQAPVIYYLAFVGAADTTFLPEYARHDEHVADYSVSQSEGDFAGLTITIETPSLRLLDPELQQWVWLSMDDGTDLVPLFHGRVVALPANLQRDTVTLDFTARPADFEEQKRTVAAGLRSLPFFDFAYIDPQMWDDADTTLEARTDAWHIDRLTNAVTISSLLEGEDGTLNITSDEIPNDGFDLSYSGAPLRRVDLQMRAMWTQQITGSIDITAAIKAAFQAAGSPAGFVTSYTGAGLYNSWPLEGDSQSGVYTFGPQVIEVADGISIKRKFKAVKVKYESAPGADGGTTPAENRKVYFRRWAFKVSSIVKYEAGIERTEDISFAVYADVQAVTADETDAQAEIITLSSGAIGTPVGEGSAQETPIGDVSRDAYFPTSRGQASIQYGLAHARALMLRRARCAVIKVKVPFTTAIGATLRKSAMVYHPKLPGGVAVGKITGYQFGASGTSGAQFGELTISCLAGRAGTFAPISGTPTYCASDCMGPDYQEFSSSAVIADVTDMRYTIPSAAVVQPAVVGLVSVTVINGETDQKDAMSHKFIDVSAAADAVNNVHTKVDLRMTPLDTSPREVRYIDTDVDLPVPLGIDLGEST